MATRFITIDRETPLLLPPDLREWVPANHLAHFILDGVQLVPVNYVICQRGGVSPTRQNRYRSQVLASLES